MLTVTIGDKVHDFDPASVTFDEGEAIERAFGGTYSQWSDAFDSGSLLARRLLVWLLLHRDNPELRVADLGAMSIQVGVEVPDKEKPAAKRPTRAAKTAA